MTDIHTKQTIGKYSRNIGDISKTADTDLIADFTPHYTNSVVEVYVVPRGNSAVFTVQRKGDSTTTEVLNQGGILVDGSAYSFSFASDRNEEYNIQANAEMTDCTVIFTEVK